MSTAEKSEMEEIIRTEKLRRSGESASLDVTESLVDGDEVTQMGNMKHQVNTRLEQISASLDEEKKKFQLRLEREMEQFDRKQTAETDKLREKHDRDKSSLTARHRQVYDRYIFSHNDEPYLILGGGRVGDRADQGGVQDEDEAVQGEE